MLFIAAKVKSNQMYNSIQLLILFIINFVSDVFYPLIPSRTPFPLLIVSYLNPLTYISDGIRADFGSPAELFSIWRPVETVVLIGETIVMFVLAYCTYSRVNVSTS
jgi:ABC-type polysaccharide/polyol phosphate export permease